MIEVNAKNGKASSLSKGGKFPQAIGLLDDDNVLVADPDKFDVPGAVIKVNVHNGHRRSWRAAGRWRIPSASRQRTATRPT